MRSKGPLQHEGSRPAPRPGGEPPGDPDGQAQLAQGDARGSGGVLQPPGLPVRHNPEDPPGDSGDDGGGGDGPDESNEGTPVESDYDGRPPHKPAGDPNPDDHHDRDSRLYKSMTINKWAKPIPKLDLPPRIHTQKASKIKQIWETWCVHVALALSTWNSLAVPYWSDIYGQAERDYEKWRKSTMTARYKHETRFLYGRKGPIPPNCDAIEALLRLELLTQFPDWLTRKATMLGCTSSHEIVRMALKEIFPNEDATRFDLVEELYSLPQKPPATMRTFAAWLEDWVTKLVAADEISAYAEPRRAMAVLSHVGKPVQASDTFFMTEWVAIFRESGLRDDVSVENLREACLQLVVCARARARELMYRLRELHEPLSLPTQYLLPKVEPRLRLRQLCANSSSRLKVASLVMNVGRNTRARMENVSDAAQRDIRLLLAHDLQRASLVANLSNRLKVKAVLHLPRLRQSLHRVPSPRHNQRRKEPKEEGKVRKTSLPPSLPQSPLGKQEKSPLTMMTLRRKSRMRSMTGKRTKSMSLRRIKRILLLSAPSRQPTTLMSLKYVTRMMVNLKHHWETLRVTGGCTVRGALDYG